MRFDRKNSVIVLEVEIEGTKKRKLRMALDTGSTFVVIPPAICKSIGCVAKPRGKKIMITTASCKKRLPILKIPYIRVAGVEAKNVETLPMSLPGNAQAQGLLGLTFLRQFRLDLDYGSGSLKLTPKKKR